MKLFSKRNKIDENRIDYLRTRPVSARDNDFLFERRKRLTEIINSNSRTRLVSMIKFLTSSDSFLEKYVLIDDRKDKIHYLNKRFIDDFSESELGYKFSDFFSFYPFSFKGELVDKNEDSKGKIYNDYWLFDLIETIILFSKESQRKNVTGRIKQILEEEKTGFSIKESIITRDNGENLRSISGQLKDQKLSSKINSYYSFLESEDFINASKISSEILNIIISDENKTKKKIIDATWKKVSKLIVDNSKTSEFEQILEQASKLCQSINNNIFDIRHTEEDRVKVSNEFVYKMSSYYNIALIEVILTSLKDDFISSDDWEKIKQKYIENYKINKDTFYYVPDPKSQEEDVDDDINPDDIPF